jgi:hypothetical protein
MASMGDAFEAAPGSKATTGVIAQPEEKQVSVLDGPELGAVRFLTIFKRRARRISLVWVPPEAASAELACAATKYTVRVKTAGQEASVAETSEPFFTAEGLKPGQAYTFEVTAHASGFSASSAQGLRARTLALRRYTQP